MQIYIYIVLLSGKKKADYKIVYERNAILLKGKNISNANIWKWKSLEGDRNSDIFPFFLLTVFSSFSTVNMYYWHNKE